MREGQGHLTVNSLILERYQIEDVIAEGGFGVVYRAKDLETEQPVAIKALRKDRTDREYVERFRLEFFISKFFIDSPNIITVNDLGQDKDNWYLEAIPIGQFLRISEFDVEPKLAYWDRFLVLEYLAGGSLTDFVQREALLTIQQACRITLDICRGLQDLHSHKLDIVHRDLKPSNILLRANGQAVIADFGIAQVSNLSQRTNLQNQQPHIHTPAYSSPEQKDINHPGYLTPASDLYSLGLILYELLTGQRFARSRQLPPSKLTPRIPVWLDQVVVKLLKEKPAERYQEAAKVAQDLRTGLASLSDGADYLTTHTDNSPRPVAPKTRLRIGVVGAAVAAVAIGLVVFYQILVGGSSSSVRPSTTSSNLVDLLPNPTSLATASVPSSVPSTATVPPTTSTFTSAAPTGVPASSAAGVAPATPIPTSAVSTTIIPATTNVPPPNTVRIIPTATSPATATPIATRVKNETPLANSNPTAATNNQPKPAYAQLWWNFNAPANDIYNLDQILKVEQKGDHSFWAVDFSFTDSTAQGFLGLQTDGGRFDGSVGEMGIFSVWNAIGAEGPSCQKFEEGGSGYSCRVALTIQPGAEYRLRLWALKVEDQKEWWGAWIYDSSTQQDYHVGNIILPAPKNLFLNQIYSFSSYFGGNTDCAKTPQSVVTFKLPGANNKGDDVGSYAYPSEIGGWSKSECPGGSARLARTNGTVSGVQLTLGGTPNSGRAVNSEKITT
jgi:serine/threonine protein kinase